MASGSTFNSDETAPFFSFLAPPQTRLTTTTQFVSFNLIVWLHDSSSVITGHVKDKTGVHEIVILIKKKRRFEESFVRIPLRSEKPTSIGYYVR
ncbi:hypothetical protein L6452_16266 [Arctium lappa]|uniref:Uncharacterized protein n=1 Tax=Arctium lappa TaxID=4217 RepID=A0ACB9C077_ARCLA|nr:hypothetical protein L6452_16266 [Arctium lappa]